MYTNVNDLWSFYVLEIKAKFKFTTTEIQWRLAIPGLISIAKRASVTNL